MRMNEQTNEQKIVTITKKAYSITEKIFCCKCFHCLQDETIFTSNVRKQTLQRMIKNFVLNQDEDTLFDPIKLMILIYLCQDDAITKSHLQRCRINPSSEVDSYRTDLQFYIPQLCNYMVFHEDLKHTYLVEAIQHATRLDFYFGHLYYFYMNSLEKTIGQYEIRVFKQIKEYKEKFLNQISRVYQGQMLNSFQYYWGQKIKMYPTEPDTALIIKSYGTKKEANFEKNPKVSIKDIYLPNYSSIFHQSEEKKQLFSFKSTINFFEDLFLVSQDLKNFENKNEKLKEQIQRINAKLPACVYVPFLKKSLRFYNILNILPNESKIFSTKQRAPFYICLEVYCPAQTLNQENQKRFWDKIQKPVSLKRHLKSEVIFSGNRRSEKYHIHGRSRKSYSSSGSDRHSPTINTEILIQRQPHRYLTNKLLQFSNDQETQPRLTSSPNSRQTVELKSLHPKDQNITQRMNEMFGQDAENMFERLKAESIYGGIQSYTLIHLIVKTADNLKQEQFALQLIYQFDYIFKLESLPLILTPYEVLSMGPDCGIIEMVKDSITFDKLKKILKTDFSRLYTLKEFFEIYYNETLATAKDKFMKSLAAYSLVMYFLQAKDRHNGNILLHKTGKIFHIDFGFFLSNMPGKGMELEKDCPFKLMSQYIEVLDGPQSYYFKKFRQLLFLGFKAVRKHQNKVLMLVKMMYSSSGMTMPCFEKGEFGIAEMQKRFNPPDVINDAQLNLHCQKLIDSSLDNWAAKWYDRWQYWAQGIFY